MSETATLLKLKGQKDDHRTNQKPTSNHPRYCHSYHCRNAAREGT